MPLGWREAAAAPRQPPPPRAAWWRGWRAAITAMKHQEETGRGDPALADGRAVQPPGWARRRRS